MENQIWKILDIGQYYCFEIWCPALIWLYFGSLMLYRNEFELETLLNMSPLKSYVYQPPKTFIAREIIHKFRQYQISRYKIVHYFKSYTPYCFAYISAPWYRTKMFLYSRRSYSSDLSIEICPSLLACLLPEKL